MTTTSLQTPAVDNSADDNEDFDASTASARPVLWVTLLLAGLFALAGFVALGMWQVNRLNWKTDLIQRIDQRVKATPVAAPGPAEWAAPVLSGLFLNPRLRKAFLAPEAHLRQVTLSESV